MQRGSRLLSPALKLKSNGGKVIIRIVVSKEASRTAGTGKIVEDTQKEGRLLARVWCLHLHLGAGCRLGLGEELAQVQRIRLWCGLERWEMRHAVVIDAELFCWAPRITESIAWKTRYGGDI